MLGGVCRVVTLVFLFSVLTDPVKTLQARMTSAESQIHQLQSDRTGDTLEPAEQPQHRCSQHRFFTEPAHSGYFWTFSRAAEQGERQ